MNNLGTLYRYEFKKIVNRKIVWSVSLIVVALSMFLSLSELVSTATYYGVEEVSGYQAMKINRDNARELSGSALDDTLLREMQENCSDKSREEKSSKTLTSGGQVAVTFGESEDDEIEVMPKYFPIYFYVRQITEDRESALSINSSELYAMRQDKIAQNRFDQMLTDKEYDYWRSRDSEIRQPFIYEYTDGWSNLWSYAYTINYLLFLLLTISLSNVFSVEYYRKTDAIILCSQYGKKQLYFAKLLAGATFSTISAILIFAVTLLSSIVIYGADGFHAALQVAFPMSSWKMSMGESVLTLFFVFLVISILYGCTIMFLSEVLKNNVAVMAIPFGIMILTMMIDIPYQFRIASQFYDLLPTNLLTAWELWDDRLINVFGKHFINYQFAPIVYLMVTIILILIGKTIYQKYQVKER